MKDPKDELERALTVKEVAELENTCERTIRRRMLAGELPAMRDGRQYKILLRNLRAYRLRRMLG